MAQIIDVSRACGAHASYLATAGVTTIMRYYSRDTGIPEKRLGLNEAQAFAAAGVRLGVVHEARHGDKIASFSAATGALDASYCSDYARNTIRQPSGSTIYFAVDFDASAKELQDCIIPYFLSVNTVLKNPGAGGFKIGVYGSGRTCQTITGKALADFSWLAQSTGWADYAPFLASNAWSLRQLMPAKVGEIKCDPDDSNGEFGDFALPVLLDGSTAERLVIAREGLRLRAGPGANYGVVRVLPFHTRVRAMKSVGEWVMIDVNGDGAADGFVSDHYLR